MTQALGTFGVRSKIPQAALDVLDLANEYRDELVSLYHERHERTIDLRNAVFPDLWTALTQYEAAKHACFVLDTAIKKHHTKVLDRNAVTVDQRCDLDRARAVRDNALARVRVGRAQWSATLAGWRLWFSSQTDWKKVKTLDKRRALYAALKFPTAAQLQPVLDAAYGEAVAKSKQPDKVVRIDAATIDMAVLERFGRLDIECDLRERELSAEYQSRGLFSGIRGEIDKASQPKIGKKGIGVRYECGHKPDLPRWRKLTTPFCGGLSLSAALEGTPLFRLTDEGPLRGSRGSASSRRAGYRNYRVEQQIGTASHPCLVSYRIIAERQFAADTRFQLWSLCLNAHDVVFKNKLGVVREATAIKATAIPVVAATIEKPTGVGLVHCRLSWSVTGDGGIQAAVFSGEHVNERLILPTWLVAARMSAKETLAACDLTANEFLASIGERPATGRKQGVGALRAYLTENPDADDAREVFNSMLLEVNAARRQQARAIRCIEKIYETVTRRVCSLHGEIAIHAPDLTQKKKYDKRNLLAQDAMPRAARERLHAVAPGKLKELLAGYGLVASCEALDEKTWTARDGASTDVFTSWVVSLGRRAQLASGNIEVARVSVSGQ